MATDFNLKPRLEKLASNLWWSWNVELDNLFRSIDLELWRNVNHNPVAFLRDVPDETLAVIETDARTLALVSHAERRMERYMTAEGRWAQHHAPGLAEHPVAYFSPEFCGTPPVIDPIVRLLPDVSPRQGLPAESLPVPATDTQARIQCECAALYDRHGQVRGRRQGC